MTRYNSYRNNINQINESSTASRTADKVNDVNRSLNDIKGETLKLKIMVQAMLEIMVEKGISPDLINEKIDKIVEDPKTFEPVIRESKPCPVCGRTVVDNGSIPLSGTCLYCGTTVRFPPHFESPAQ
jgi:DNA repair exonuclease SbcCD ATPase subunit